MAWYVFQLAVLFARGPHVSRYDWVGWIWGWEARKSVVDVRKRELDETKDQELATAQGPVDEKIET